MSTHKPINCHRCRHFYVTWEKNFPYGCRHMGFKSAHLPSLVVLQASGEPCLAYAPKSPRTPLPKDI